MEFLTGGQLVTLTQLEVEHVNLDTQSSALVALPNSVNSLLHLVSAWITEALDMGRLLFCYLVNKISYLVKCCGHGMSSHGSRSLYT